MNKFLCFILGMACGTALGYYYEKKQVDKLLDAEFKSWRKDMEDRYGKDIFKPRETVVKPKPEEAKPEKKEEEKSEKPEYENVDIRRKEENEKAYHDYTTHYGPTDDKASPEDIAELKQELHEMYDDEDYTSEHGCQFPVVISPDEVDEHPEYSVIDVSQFIPSQGSNEYILAFDNGELVEDATKLFGDFEKHWGEYEGDCVYVRNDAMKCHYVIVAEPITYEAKWHRKPVKFNA